MVRIAGVLVSVLLVSATSAYAQRDRLLVEPSPPAEWGVTFSLQPSWDMYPLALAPLAGAERSEIEAPDGSSTLGGSTWSIGFARGRVLGADWGVSFSQMRIRKDAVIDRLFGNDFCTPPNCLTDSQRLTFRDVKAIGPEVHFFIPFFTIKDRIVPGIELAGGVAHFSGPASVVGVEPIDPGTSFPTRIVQQDGEIKDVANHIYFDDVPWTLLGRIEPNVAVVLSSRVRVHAGLGFHYPGTTFFSLKATYFFPRAAP